MHLNKCLGVSWTSSYDLWSYFGICFFIFVSPLAWFPFLHPFLFDLFMYVLMFVEVLAYTFGKLFVL